MRDWFNRWVLAYIIAAWEFFTAPCVPLDTDWAPELPSRIERTFAVYVSHKGLLQFRAPQVTTMLFAEELTLLFMEAGFREQDIIVTEIAA